ncbi:cellulase family glycosylhydrolase [Salinimicrobium sp. TH3]|uniref:cellulase family glycosylhydrolase n=1 Tax=Salinimicrobium sp. TH3 TaxID=2997342 RepID=UPI0022750553|nr:cellulase family glycosylhydrolase [Salinimicrobium sp. TH3]MCY2686861.1 cellulase family glycosylhydrolase [Salinimicrobium sp. TH3]
MIFSKTLKYLFLWGILSMSLNSVFAQVVKNEKKGDVYVDESGVMRWGHNKEEVKGFGVNYSVPFAHAFRTGQKLGVDLKAEIRKDIYHFSRLGFDLYRIHIWDTEISDEEGNLLENEHLDHFDYLINELKSRGINFVLTPIAYWGNGWPEPDEDTPGFSSKYGKEGSLTNPLAIEAQENYLAQFLEHVNPYTGIAYKDEPNVIAFEVSNEPHHRERPEKVQEFIERMLASMRSTGTKKPIFYNVTHSTQLAEVYAASGIDGGTFQWYPTGLGFGKELEGNLLPNVNNYKIPFDEVWKKKGLAKLVYEFDAADVMKSYMYPAMARSFRQAGMQIGTHFAYDPTFMAPFNTEYDTHFMNLAYTPSKALALMISGEIFHELPMNKDLGKYPANLNFGNFRISYEQDLAEMNSAEKFIYTNSTETFPKNTQKLKQIAGVGNSPLVKYNGKGAYFLDKLEHGVWRLEVMPDAIVVDNPFGNNSLEKTLAVIKYGKWEMEVNLPGLGKEFEVKGINEGNNLAQTSVGSSFPIEPGTYILSKKGKNSRSSYKGWSENNFTAFVAPKSTVEKTYVVHEPVPSLTEGRKHEISAEIVSNKPVEKVEAWFRNGNTYESVQLQHKEAYDYGAAVPEKMLKKGFLEYRIIVTTSEGTNTFPGGQKGNPGEWGFDPDEPYKIRVVAPETPVYLFNASEDSEHVVARWLPTINTVPGKYPGEAEFRVNVEKLFEVDPENTEAEPVYEYSFKYNFNRKARGRSGDLKNKEKLVLKGHSLNEKPVKLQVALVMNNGRSFGKVIELLPEVMEYEIDISALKPVNTVTLPRPYPTFLPLYFEHNVQESFDVEDAESLQFSIGPDLLEQEREEQHGVGIISVRLE